jgi:hypothetical protein
MTQSGHAQLLMCGSSCKFALMAIGRTTNNTQVKITSDNDAARRIGYIMAKDD